MVEGSECKVRIILSVIRSRPNFRVDGCPLQTVNETTHKVLLVSTHLSQHTQTHTQVPTFVRIRTYSPMYTGEYVTRGNSDLFLKGIVYFNFCCEIGREKRV